MTNYFSVVGCSIYYLGKVVFHKSNQKIDSVVPWNNGIIILFTQKSNDETQNIIMLKDDGKTGWIIEEDPIEKIGYQSIYIDENQRLVAVSSTGSNTYFVNADTGSVSFKEYIK